MFSPEVADSVLAGPNGVLPTTAELPDMPEKLDE
jgi:hypothetical protein